MELIDKKGLCIAQCKSKYVFYSSILCYSLRLSFKSYCTVRNSMNYFYNPFFLLQSGGLGGIGDPININICHNNMPKFSSEI